MALAMMGAKFSRRLVLVAAFGLLTADAEGRCNIDLAVQFKITPSTNAVFLATVEDVRPARAGQMVTFAISRVYRGRIPRQIVVYNATQVVDTDGRLLDTSDSIAAMLGQSYIVFVRPPTPQQRRIAKFPAEAYAMQGCDLFPTPPYNPDTLGPGYSPQ